MADDAVHAANIMTSFYIGKLLVLVQCTLQESSYRTGILQSSIRNMFWRWSARVRRWMEGGEADYQLAKLYIWKGASVAADKRQLWPQPNEGGGERGSERLFETVENVDLSVFLLLPPPQGSRYYPRRHVPVRPRPTSPFLHVHKGPDKIQ